MRNILPEKATRSRCGIVNLDPFDTIGAHWVFYYKNYKIKYYFDSYRKQTDKPIMKTINYLGKHNIIFKDYNDSRL